jgi:hypothetical protein
MTLFDVHVRRNVLPTLTNLNATGALDRILAWCPYLADCATTGAVPSSDPTSTPKGISLRAPGHAFHSPSVVHPNEPSRLAGAERSPIRRASLTIT